MVFANDMDINGANIIYVKINDDEGTSQVVMNTASGGIELDADEGQRVVNACIAASRVHKLNFITLGTSRMVINSNFVVMLRGTTMLLELHGGAAAEIELSEEDADKAERALKAISYARSKKPYKPKKD